MKPHQPLWLLKLINSLGNNNLTFDSIQSLEPEQIFVKAIVKWIFLPVMAAKQFLFTTLVRNSTWLPNPYWEKLRDKGKKNAFFLPLGAIHKVLIDISVGL